MRVFLAFILAMLACSGVPAAWAQGQDTGGSFITPFPENETYRLQVYGDSLAEGLAGGLIETFTSDPRLQVQKKVRTISGVLRAEVDDEAWQIEREFNQETPHIGVVMLGLADRIPWRPQSGRRYNLGSDEWKAEYGRRLDRLMRAFRKKSIAVYWVSLPIMRRPEASDDAQMINEIIRERAYVNGAKFIDVFSSFADDAGAFNAYGPDLAGKNRLLREPDGAHFTQAGYRKLAHFVERELKRDLTQARADRNIPLAGADAEQKRIRAKANPQAAAMLAGKAGTPGARARDAKGAAPGEKAGQRPAPAAAETGGGDLRADNARINLKTTGAQGKEETIALDILRPAIPATVLAHITRRESAERASQVGDPLMTEILGGLTVISTVTPIGDAAAGGRRRSSPTNSAYYRVLVKGERQSSKPGRADEMPWPPPEAPPAKQAEQTPSPGDEDRAPRLPRRLIAPGGSAPRG